MGGRLAEEERVGGGGGVEEEGEGAPVGRGARGPVPIKLRRNKMEGDLGENLSGGGDRSLPGWCCPRAGGKAERTSRCLTENSLPLALLACKLIGPI